MSDDISIPSPTYRVPRQRRGMDPGTRKLALIAVGIGGFLIVVGGGWHMLTHHREGVPVVQAEPGPMRVKPTNPGGLQVEGAHNDIFSGGGDTADARLAPPPQTPDPQALRAMETPKPAPAPAHVAATGLVLPPPAREAAAAPQAVTTAPAAQPGAQLPAASPSTARPMVAAGPKAATPAAAAQPAAAATTAAASAQHPVAGHVQVQLAALSSEPAAHAEWDRLARRWPDLRAHRPLFSRIEHDGHFLWRVRAGGFADVAAAASFCQRMRAAGGGCSVADF